MVVEERLGLERLGAGAIGARTAGVAVGTALGVLNLVWAVGATVAPLAAATPARALPAGTG